MDLAKASRKLSELDINITLDNLSVEVLWFRAMQHTDRWKIGRHLHSSFEFHFIASGFCNVKTDSDLFRADAGTFYLTGPGINHEQWGDGEEKFIEYSLNCNISTLQNAPSEASSILSALQSAPCKPLKDIYCGAKYFENALEEAYQQKLGFFMNIKNLLLLILSASVRAFSDGNTEKYSFPVRDTGVDYRFQLINHFINDNILNPVTVKDISRFLFLSEKQVCRIIEAKTGLSTKEYIVKNKLENAKKLLRETDAPIKEIAVSVGFSSEYYFSQFFRNHENTTPSAYRKTNLGMTK